MKGQEKGKYALYKESFYSYQHHKTKNMQLVKDKKEKQ